MKNIIFLLGLSLILLNACKKDVEVKDVEFNVVKVSETAKTGLPVQFSITGNPDIISFYSGEIGSEYDFVGSRILKPAYSLIFDSQILDGTQPNQFSVQASTDFNGTYDLENIKKATWTDISNLFQLASPANNRTFVSSGEKDISNLIVDGKPLYIALKYITKPQTINGRYNLWRVQNLLIQSSDDFNGKTTLTNQAGAGWRIILSPNYEPNRVTSTTSITMMGNGTNRDVETEAWVVSRALAVPSQINLGNEKSLAIKSVTDVALSNFNYSYKKPGTYKASFVAINAGGNETKKLVKQLDVVVNP